MFRGVFVAVTAAVAVLLILTMVMIAANGPAALAQPGAQPASPATRDAVAQPPAEVLKALARAAEEWVKNNPKGRTEAVERPVPKDNAYAKVSPEEREAMGLPAPTWVARYGKVQPAVRETLQNQKLRIERKQPVLASQGDRPCGFQDTAYVDVYLSRDARDVRDLRENRAAVKQAQSRILNKLTAREFSTIFAFRDTAAVTGYVDEAGLAKLAEAEGVVAVGLDDQARSEAPPRALDELQRGVQRDGKEEGPQRPLDRVGKVKENVYTALNVSNDGYVYVLVVYRPVDWMGVGVASGDAVVRNMEDRVLSSLNAEEFRCAHRGLSGGIGGYVNAAGLAKLDGQPDVDAVVLTSRHDWDN